MSSAVMTSTRESAERLVSSDFSTEAFFYTPDGSATAGQPNFAHYFLPSNDHPSDKATFDFRFDVPCFGLLTLETMRQAGLGAAALEARGVILLDKPAVLEKARSWKIALLGFR